MCPSSPIFFFCSLSVLPNWHLPKLNLIYRVYVYYESMLTHWKRYNVYKQTILVLTLNCHYVFRSYHIHFQFLLICAHSFFFLLHILSSIHRMFVCVCASEFSFFLHNFYFSFICWCLLICYRLNRTFSISTINMIYRIA